MHHRHRRHKAPTRITDTEDIKFPYASQKQRTLIPIRITVKEDIKFPYASQTQKT